MRTPRNTITTALASLALLTAVPAMASERPGREVRIHEDRFAKLSPEEQQRVLVLKERIGELMAADRSAVDPAQRAEMRSEWKALKEEMRQHNRGGTVIYISTAGLILIILLLIILL